MSRLPAPRFDADDMQRLDLTQLDGPIQATHTTKRDLAAGFLRESIVTGALPPGSRLAVKTLTERYGFSPTPVREALSLLEAEGLVTIRPHKGAVVPELVVDEVLELYAIRSAMECLATEQAIPNLDDSRIGEIRRLLAKMENLRRLSSDFLVIDRQFHSTLYDAAGYERWTATIHTLWRRSLRYMQLGASMRGFEVIHNEHRALLHACEARDTEQARTVIHSHLMSSRDSILERMRVRGAREADMEQENRADHQSGGAKR